MGAPRRRKPRRTGITRRQFLIRAGAGAAAITALPMLPGCGRSESVVGSDLTENPFKHSVASGDPMTDRVILWTRITAPVNAPVPVNYVVASDPEMKHVVSSGLTQATADRDYTVKVDASGLQPFTTYYYQFSVGSFTSPVGRTRTLPTGSPERLRFGVVVCASYAHGLFNAYRRVAERADLDFVLHLGDYIYEYSSGEDGHEVYGDFRAYEPPHEILTLQDYRIRHAQYKRDVDLQELHRQHPMINIWDDHEFADNAYKDGAVNHGEKGFDEGAWSVRVANAMKAYYEWMPTREPDDKTNPQRYNRSLVFGDLAELILLEERVGARDKQLPGNVPPELVTELLPPLATLLPITPFTQSGAYTDPNRTMLGNDGEAWLIDRLRTSSSQWKLLGQGVMFAQLKVVGVPNALGASIYLNSDQWDGYAPARDRIFDALKGDAANSKIDNVVVLTGDIHCSWACDITPDPNNPLDAAGGYNAINGNGSLAVEYVCTSITSPGLDALAPIQDVLRVTNPHIKYVDLAKKGYMVMDVTPERVLGEYWYVDTISAPSSTQTFGTAFQVAPGTNHLVAASQSTPRDNPPPLAG
ncbi:MAG: alkaline phosphatase D family protein [Pseudomonadota bacterium]